MMVVVVSRITGFNVKRKCFEFLYFLFHWERWNLDCYINFTMYEKSLSSCKNTLKLNNKRYVTELT